MKKIFLTAALICISFGAFAQVNLVKDGSFEGLETGYQLPRIAAFTDFGDVTQTANPTADEESVVKGEWYRKASNTGYLKAVVVDDDSLEGDKAVKLSVNKNSGQQKLDSWYSNTLVQFLELQNNTEYTVSFWARSTGDRERLYAGLLDSGYSQLKGTKWFDIDGEWTQYTVTVKTKSVASTSAVILGLQARYDDNEKTLASTLLIDSVSVVEK